MQEWERSFPARQIRGHQWICDVLEDLESYCQHNGLSHLQKELSALLRRLDLEEKFEHRSRRDVSKKIVG